VDLAQLWAGCKAGDATSRGTLIERYVALAGRIARRVPAPTSGPIGRDDLESAALLGLIDAVDRFEPGRGVPFEAYAMVRIRGAVLDELRSANERGRGRRDETLPNVSLDALLALGDRDLSTPDEAGARHDEEDLRDRVVDALRSLTPRQRELLARYYGDSLTLREAGVRMGISEARACQLHGRAIAILRRQIAVGMGFAAA
jgi:RNA polymerase sigma factor for flagellar operon FliA